MRALYAMSVHNIPEWKKKINFYCYHCDFHAEHWLKEELAPRVRIVEGVRGVRFEVSYTCARKVCKKDSYHAVFVPSKYQSSDMFPDSNNA